MHLASILAVAAVASAFTPVSQPNLQYSQFGNQIGFFGDFNAISFYSYINASAINNANSQKLYLRDASANNQVQLAELNGNIDQLVPLSSDSVVLNGNYSQINGQSFSGPVIVNISSLDITPIIPSSSGRNSKRDDAFNGTVSSVLVDNGLIYLGGSFQFNNTYGAAIYDTASKSLKSTPFQGFGENSVVNAISKIYDPSNEDQGSIIFGGKFDTLGLKNLLVHNSTTNSSRLNNTNSTNTSLINAEQVISLRHGIFSNTNGDGSAPDSSLICPLKSVEWSLNPGQGGQWAVELPDEMKGITPTKARIYIPPGPDGTKTFRIYSYPNNGIMNLSYVNPENNEIEFCDAWCPLIALSDLEEITSNNAKNSTDLSDDDTVYVDEDGSYSIYYDPSTKTKVMGYGANYQEFAFENEVALNKVGVTVTDWYGSKGTLGGFQLYLNSIIVYGNNSLNDPNCDEENPGAVDNASEIEAGSFQSIKALAPNVRDNDYLVSTDTNAKIILYPNISYSGDYSIIMNTPGCIDDDSCAKRSIVNVTVLDNEGNQLATQLIYQNNDYYKFDYLYYGHLNGTSESSGSNRIEISYQDAIIPDTQDPWVVVDKVTANIVSLDKYYDNNKTNSSTRRNSRKGELTYITLNGLFEYSLANFSDFDETLISYTRNNQTIISPNNTFVGNSSINLLSGQLSNETEINQIQLLNGSDSRSLILLGSFESDSKNLTLSNNNMITLDIGSYNSTSNETEATIKSKRSLNAQVLHKRADSSDIFGASFNNTINNVVGYNGAQVFLGGFGLNNNGNNSVNLKDLSNNNQSTSSINNFALYSNNEWYGFGNNFVDTEYNQFASVSVENIEYLVFSANSSSFKVWNSSNSSWADNSKYLLNISQLVDLSSDQQILGGGSFNIMDFYSIDQAYSSSNDSFASYNISIESTNSKITNTFYVNNSLSVVSGDFEADSITNLGFINNNSTDRTIRQLQGSFEWSDDAQIQTLYVDNENHYLFVGFNGSVRINNSNNLTGLIIYDLQNNTISSVQPSALSSDNDDLRVNSLVLYDKGQKLLVGGNFNKAGSLDCVSMCIFDIENTRWINPQSDNNNQTVAGEITDVKFYQSNSVLIGGNLTLNGEFVNFLTYNFDNQAIATKTSFNSLGSSKPVRKFLINDQDNSNLNGRMIAYGDGFISGYDGSKWNDIGDGINFNSNTLLNDVKLLSVAKSDTGRNGTYFDKSNVLALAGKIDLRDYGLVNVALFNGSTWSPYVYTTTPKNEIGEIHSLLILDSFRFQSSDDINNKSSKLSKGKVVGISLACALGSTTFLGLLYIIPYFALFRKLLDENGINHQRIQENEMMDAVNPEDLFHEIDLQRNH
ncbi:uncharacterized protein CANTADRAFT_91632 [Suhomyces tanzawaensis NRRL Y-17324]|uniref:Bud site selection protein RAX2 n=1 Tax=Suhomyces tanzawaensis NRRL Y-17324 TaxID=984487 RepID=A0A1E4SFG7_9ASCO|nr:uncharacterized protein CANTADRAFT_91632 [Suhomyces tanzawaensis NRRL Y-17324]ODV78210.1 hypothetical protein CANTADRAFT_91632 [Suhomyces tanzawaensis NRRL Y-17324]